LLSRCENALEAKSIAAAYTSAQDDTDRHPTIKYEEHTMNWDQIEGNWKQLKGNAKEQWGKLTDDDLDVIDGKREHLAGKIQEVYGVTKDDAEKQLSDWQTAQKEKACCK
jgi:uncharacterized protein YjbJ (UPF0337 family)